MNLIYLLDTNIVSEPLKHNVNSNVIQSLLIHQSECAIPALVLHEMLQGYYKTPTLNQRYLIWQHIQSIARLSRIFPHKKELYGDQAYQLPDKEGFWHQQGLAVQNPLTSKKGQEYLDATDRLFSITGSLADRIIVRLD